MTIAVIVPERVTAPPKAPPLRLASHCVVQMVGLLVTEPLAKVMLKMSPAGVIDKKPPVMLPRLESAIELPRSLKKRGPGAGSFSHTAKGLSIDRGSKGGDWQRLRSIPGSAGAQSVGESSRSVSAQKLRRRPQ